MPVQEQQRRWPATVMMHWPVVTSRTSSISWSCLGEVGGPCDSWCGFCRYTQYARRARDLADQGAVNGARGMLRVK
jgi:hypothetical protein